MNMRKYALLPMLLLAMTTILLSQEQLEVEGAIIIENSSDPTPSVGTIRWNGNDFEGFTNSGWKSLTGCDCCQCNFECQDIELFNDYSNGAITDQIHINSIANVDCYRSIDVSFSISNPMDSVLFYISSGPNTVSQMVYFWDNGIVVDSCSFDIIAIDCSANQGSLFACNGLMIQLVNGVITVNVNDFIQTSPCSNLNFSFSANQSDTLRTFNCTNIGDIQITFFVFKNGIYHQNCFAISTVIDSTGSCMAMPCNSDTYTCNEPVFKMTATNPPSYTISIYDIVDIDVCTGNLSAALSANPADQFRTYGCTNVGDIQITIFIFDNGVFLEACFSVITILDPSGLCQ